MATFTKKKYIFVIFGRFKRKNPRAIGSNSRILDRNVVVSGDGVLYVIPTSRALFSLQFLGLRENKGVRGIITC